MHEHDPIQRLIIPPAKAQEIVARAGQVYLRDCVCRTRKQACPLDAWEVCLISEHASPDQLQDARKISTQEALSILQASTQQGLLNQLFYRKTSLQLTELCNCCTCCCAPLRKMKRVGNWADQPRSDYVAITDKARCTACGLCENSCTFQARSLGRSGLLLIDERCFGCSRCVDACPKGAIQIEVQAGRGIPVPSVV